MNNKKTKGIIGCIMLVVLVGIVVVAGLSLRNSKSESTSPTTNYSATQTGSKQSPSLPEEKVIPGQMTLKNFLATALTPVGKVLWVTGGGWLFYDVGGDESTRTIGLSNDWISFFDEEDADYDRSETEPPEDGLNIHHEKGLDSLSYIGWTVYNTVQSENLANDGYTFVPDEMVESLSEFCYFESAQDLAEKTPAEIASSLSPGDFIIMPGRHTYIVLGGCEDGSLVIAHAAWNVSTTGASGGGIQISSMNEGGTTDCKAFALADKYMSEKYPKWNGRYDTIAKDIEIYANFYNYAVNPEANGVIHWKEGVLADPDGYSGMTAEEILADLYK